MLRYWPIGLLALAFAFPHELLDIFLKLQQAINTAEQAKVADTREPAIARGAVADARIKEATAMQAYRRQKAEADEATARACKAMIEQLALNTSDDEINPDGSPKPGTTAARMYATYARACVDPMASDPTPQEPTNPTPKNDREAVILVSNVLNFYDFLVTQCRWPRISSYATVVSEAQSVDADAFRVGRTNAKNAIDALLRAHHGDQADACRASAAQRPNFEAAISTFMDNIKTHNASLNKKR